MNWHWLTALFYLTASLFYFVHLWTQKQRIAGWGFNSIIVGAIVHTATLVILYSKGNPIAGGLDRSLYLFSWLTTVVYLVVCQIKSKALILGAFIAPLAFLMTLPSVILPQGVIKIDPSLGSPWILVHIILVFLGEALFTVAFIAGVLYIFQERQIKSKRMGSFLKKLPSLTTLDNLNHVCLLTGFPLLTIGLALGLLSAKEIWGALWNWGQKETWSLVTWFLYAVLIHGRLASGWKGRRAALGAVLGFGVILFTFFVIGYLAPGQHDFLESY
jgi:cytochrome c-type biogenesis protein CcsB